MYSITNHSNSEWGIEGYEISKKYFDSNKAILDRNLAKNEFKSSKPKGYVTKRGNFLDDHVRPLFGPGPGSYKVVPDWVRPADIEKGKKRRPNTDRNTFIDAIFREQKLRVKPGPGAHNIVQT